MLITSDFNRYTPSEVEIGDFNLKFSERKNYPAISCDPFYRSRRQATKAFTTIEKTIQLFYYLVFKFSPRIARLLVHSLRLALWVCGFV